MSEVGLVASLEYGWSHPQPPTKFGADRSDNICDGNGGGGTVFYKVFESSVIVQWDNVRNYVAPPANYNNDPRCDPTVTPGGWAGDDTSWSPYWWTPTCPASQVSLERFSAV